MLLARRDIEERAIHVDIRSLGAAWEPFDVSVPTFDGQTVSGFLNRLWIQIDDVLPRSVPAFTFGRAWALRHVESGILLTDLGSRWADRHGVLTDDRILESVGLIPGARLKAERLQTDSRRHKKDAKR